MAIFASLQLMEHSLPPQPIVSVLIATMNRKSVLQKTLTEYRNQTYPRVEIVVIDNGSTDGTREMIQELFPDVVYFHLPINIGAAALNLGFEIGKGDLFWRTDDDAWPMLPTTLETAVNIMQKYPDVDVATGVTYLVEEDQYLIATHRGGSIASIAEEGETAVTFIGTCSMIRRSTFEIVGGFWDAFYLEEEDMTARIIKSGGQVRCYSTFGVNHLTQFSTDSRVPRWLLMSKQVVRFQFKYYSLHQAVGRASVYFVFAVALGFWHRVGFLALIEGTTTMVAAAARAWRLERGDFDKAFARRLSQNRSAVIEVYKYMRTALKRKRKVQEMLGRKQGTGV